MNVLTLVMLWGSSAAVAADLAQPAAPIHGSNAQHSKKRSKSRTTLMPVSHKATFLIRRPAHLAYHQLPSAAESRYFNDGLHGGMLEDGANLESTLADSQICQALHFDKTCRPYPGKLVLLVTVNHEMIDFFSQWHASASKFQNESCMHLRVMAEDEEAKRHLTQLSEQKRWDLDIRMDHIPLSLVEAGVPFNTKEYNKLVDRRPLYIHDLLEQGCTTFYVDIDTIWKKSPFMEIVAKDKGQGDLYSISDDRHEVIPVQHFCTCFMYINPTAASLNIIGQWRQSLQGRTIVNQGAFNEVLSRDNLRQKVTQLPYEKFPPGCSYSRLKHEACIAHANWMVGHEAKGNFLKAVAEEMHLQVNL